LTTLTTSTTHPGNRIFTLVWLGHVASLLGSGLTNFSLGVWAFQRTGSATQFALIGFCSALSAVVALPLAGPLVDRYDRRLTMLLSNVAAGAVKLSVLLLLLAGRLGMWHIYVAAACIGWSAMFLNLAFTTATTVLVRKTRLGRASGMTQAAQAAGQVVPPLLAGVLISVINIQGILLIDLSSYVLAISALLTVRFPPHQPHAYQAEQKKTLFQHFALGWTYIKKRRGLLALLMFFAAFNFTVGLITILLTPMVLSFASARVLGIIMSLSGTGLLAGSILMSVWGGPRGRVNGVLIGGGLWGILCAVAGFRASPTLIACAVFCMSFLIPIINGCSQTIWQSKVPIELQGRVFAVRRMIGLSAVPLAFLLAGPLADRVFEPLAASGALREQFGRFFGPGRGIGLMFVLTGLLTVAAQIRGCFYRPLRHLEVDLPDTDSDVTLDCGRESGYLLGG
jgi:MFS family permease